MMWPLPLDASLDHARRKRDSGCDVVNVLSNVIWHMVLVTANLDAVAFSTLALVFIIFRLEHLFGLGCGDVQGKPSLVLVVHDAGGIDTRACQPGLDIVDSL